MRRRPLVAVAVVAIVTMLAATLVRATGPDRKPESTATSEPSSETFGPDDELIALLRRGRDLVYNAAYSVQSSDPEVAGGRLTLEVWRSPPRVRQDSDNQTDGQQAKSAAIKDGKLVRCEQPSGGSWKCVNTSEAEASDFDNLVDRIAEEVKISRVTAVDDTVNGREARCFNLSSRGGDVTQVCVDRDGVPVRIASADSKLEITRLSRSVNNRVFDPPAPISND